MTKRIFRSIFLVALVVLLLSVALLSVVFYNDYAVQYRSELKSEALSMAHAINGGLAEEDYLRSLEQDKISQIRITWIGADGTVRYDNEAAPAQMENHAARTEVADALRYGAGESERYSATLSQKTFYYACRLQDGTVLRLAGTRDSVLGILLRMLRPAVAAVLVAIALAWLLSYRLSKRIVLTTERNGLAGFTVHPMCPHAVIAVGILVAQKADYLQHTFSALFASDKTTLYTDNDSHHSETRATDGSCLGTSVAPFMRQS